MDLMWGALRQLKIALWGPTHYFHTLPALPDVAHLMKPYHLEGLNPSRRKFKHEADV
jgi:hypothetical protein